MAKYFPSLLWILRDFALKLEDSEGNVITAKQYLENALMQQKGASESIEEKNLVRKMIKTYFLERDCFPMVRPVENERDLQKLMTLSDDKIRPEFLRQSEMLRNKIYMKIKPKNFNGKLLSGQMLINLLESIIEAINEGAIPVIENSWKYITNNECLKSIRENVEYFKKIIMDYQKENISNSNFFNDLQEFSSSMIDEIINKFKKENGKRFDDINEYVHKLKLNLNQEFKKLNEENISLLKDKYILDLDKEINLLFQDKDKLLKENHINFISNLLQIKYKLDASIPDFHLKDQLSYDKIIDSIKKEYISSINIKSIDIYLKNIKEIRISSIRNEFDLETEIEEFLDNDDLISQKYSVGSEQENFELINPTIDFIPPESFAKKTKKFIPHYCIMIDISSISYDLQFPNYILNSIQTNLNAFNNSENTYICFATYDNKGIQFYTLNKNKEINVHLMNDLYNPFSPVCPKYLFFNVVNEQEDIIILIEKINTYISKR